MARKTKSQKEKALAKLSAPPPQPRTSKKAKTTHEPTLDADTVPQFTEPEQDAVKEVEAPLQDLRKPGHPLPRPPQPPASLHPSTLLLPPEADDAKLRDKYDIHTVLVAGGSKIESKVRNVLSNLKSSGEGERKKAIVALTARGPASNKCISIAEIVKREFVKGEEDRKLWQYTGCWSRLETVVEKGTGGAAGDKGSIGDKMDGREDGEAQPDDDEEETFETMQAAERKKVRNATCIVIYLSTEPVARLKELYGEQVHDKTRK